MHRRQNRSFVHWLFFQNPNKSRSSISTEEAPDTQYIGGSLYDDQAPDKWVKLAVYSDDERFDIEAALFPIHIGRENSDIIIDDESVSPLHAVMDLQKGILTITDVHSMKGVSIGSGWLDPGVKYSVSPGEIIRIGSAEIEVIDFAGSDIQTSDYPELLGRGEWIESATETHDSPIFADILDVDSPFNPFEKAEKEPVKPLITAVIEPEPPPEPELKEPPAPSTIVKLLDEPDALLFTDVLGKRVPLVEVPEPEPPPPESPPKEDPPPKAEEVTPGPTCSKCKAKNNETDKFCGKCGTSLAKPDVKPFCGKCGTKNEHKLKFCGSCGSSME